ncbi:MAG TPA: PQQ-dependent sugar dehydrogenase [Gemmatimonadaceae bacterium]|nr:PQQ-dependent sugar dehydrogenase [Gemmatimonadaceae bacterium]
MRRSGEWRSAWYAARAIGGVFAVATLAATVGCHGSEAGVASGGRVACDAGNGGLTLPDGFCATVFADSLGTARHVAVAPNGDVFVALLSGPERTDGGIMALRDTNADGHADVRRKFGETGANEVRVHGGYVYQDNVTAIVRYPLPRGSLTPPDGTKPDTIVAGFPTGGHFARTFVIDPQGIMYVNVGSPTNSCQEKDRTNGSPGKNPCTELQERAGIWRYDAGRPGQQHGADGRFATGLRNAMGLALYPGTGQLYATQHGRDQLFQNWPMHYDADQGAELPAEELVAVDDGDNFGWPYCYYDQFQHALVQAPEYGGDGKTVGKCASYEKPLVAFPGHWAPNGLLIYSGSQFPAKYRGGAFIAFHGSWNRAPKPQAGYKVVFVPFNDGRPTGTYETFADNFAGVDLSKGGEVQHRPMGLAQSPDGSLFVTDSRTGKVWKISYRGGAQ